MKTGLGLILALFAVAVFATASQAFIDSGRLPARDSDLIEMHRSIRAYAGFCVDCRGASYDRHDQAGLQMRGSVSRTDR